MFAYLLLGDLTQPNINKVTDILQTRFAIAFVERVRMCLLPISLKLFSLKVLSTIVIINSGNGLVLNIANMSLPGLGATNAILE